LFLDIPLVCLFALFARDMILLVYGNPFVTSVHPLIFLFLAAGLALFHAVPGNFLAVRKKTV
jgi:hypothetical protein